MQKLLELYKYESTRDPAHFSDAVYNANAHVLLHDDPCYRFESCDADGTLTIQMLDPDRTEVAPGGTLFKYQFEMRTADFLFASLQQQPTVAPAQGHTLDLASVNASVIGGFTASGTWQIACGGAHARQPNEMLTALDMHSSDLVCIIGWSFCQFLPGPVINSRPPARHPCIHL